MSTDAPRPIHPVLDFDRAALTLDGERHLVLECGLLTVLVDEVDTFVDLPVRITTGPLTGPTLEIGPYSIGKIQARELAAHLSGFLATFRVVAREVQQ